MGPRGKRIEAVHTAGAVGSIMALVLLIRAWNGSPVASSSDPEHQPQTLADASGKKIALRHFERIVSLTGVADQILLELCEPARIAAYSAYSSHLPRAYRYGAKPRISAQDPVENILQLRADLVITSVFFRRDHARRLRGTGVAVFDLGRHLGLTSFLEDIIAVGYLVGRPEEARAMAANFRRRMKAATPRQANRCKERALYLGLHGGMLLGGTRGTSYFDVIVHAGMIDAAAAEYGGWPVYDPERILLFDPDLLLTQQGMGASICRHPVLSKMGPCKRGGGVIELPGDILSNPGWSMLDATELLRERADQLLSRCTLSTDVIQQEVQEED